MYESADVDKELERILAIVDKCPEAYRIKAFEVLLRGYVDLLSGASLRAAPKQESHSSSATAQKLRPDQDWTSGIPPEVLPRLRALAKRKSVEADKVAALFDFSSDPFTYAPLHVEGENNNDRARKVALLVAARAFLATGRWVADWAEIKAMCTHQSCYDVSNFATGIKRGQGDVFKNVASGSNVELSATGTGQAESLLATLAGNDASA